MKYSTKMFKAYEKRLNSLEFLKVFPRGTGQVIKSAGAISEFLDEFRNQEKEFFMVLNLDTKNRVISREIISVGILDATIVHPREIFRTATMLNAHRIVLAHNHPSGDPSPSEEDLRVTRKLIEVGELIGIEVLDHVILGKGEEYYSYLGD